MMVPRRKRPIVTSIKPAMCVRCDFKGKGYDAHDDAGGDVGAEALHAVVAQGAEKLGMKIYCTCESHKYLFISKVETRKMSLPLKNGCKGSEKILKIKVLRSFCAIMHDWSATVV